jgi:hypothetical protein
MTRCERSEAVYLAAIDGRLTDEERAHARGCADCAAALEAAERFDRELEAAATELAGPALPPEITGADAVGARRQQRWIGPVSAAAGTLVVVALSLLLAGQAGVVRVGGPGPNAPPPVPHTLHVLVSNHRQFVITVDAESTVAGATSSSSTAVGGCSGAYLTLPIGDSWRVSVGGVLLGVGPPSPVAGSTSGDLTLRVSYGISAPQILDGTPAANGLDPALITSTDLAPCR